MKSNELFARKGVIIHIHLLWFSQSPVKRRDARASTVRMLANLQKFPTTLHLRAFLCKHGWLLPEKFFLRAN